MTADAKGVSWLASVIIRPSSAFAAILPPYLLVVKEVGWWVQLVSQYVQCTSLVHPLLVNYPTSSKRFPQSSGEVNFFSLFTGRNGAHKNDQNSDEDHCILVCFLLRNLFYLFYWNVSSLDIVISTGPIR